MACSRRWRRRVSVTGWCIVSIAIPAALLVVAKTSSSAAKLSKAFQRHDVQKLYWALVAGLPPLEHGIIDKPLTKAPSGGGRDFELVQTGVDGAQKR